VGDVCEEADNAALGRGRGSLSKLWWRILKFRSKYKTSERMQRARLRIWYSKRCCNCCCAWSCSAHRDLEYGSPALPETITGTERAPKTEIQARRYNVVLCEPQVHRRDFKIASLLIEI